MREVRLLRRQDEELCQRLAMDPFYVSSTTVPTTQQMNDLKVSYDHCFGSGMFIADPLSYFLSIADPQMALDYQLDAISQGPKNSKIPGPNPLPLPLVMDMHASKTLCTGLYKS
jgi:hypothetical protein